MMRTVVLGDLHVAAGPYDRFFPAIEEAFLDLLAELGESESETRLVLNGDSLDFIFAPPLSGAGLSARSPDGLFLSFSEKQSLEKLSAILLAHSGFFQGLQRFLATSPNKYLVVVPGNHDVDFFWPAVRRRFLAAIGSGEDEQQGRVQFVLGPWYVPPDGTDVAIGHGHQLDPANAFMVGDQPCWDSANLPIRKDEDEVPRLLECPGTGMLVRFAIDAAAGYPYLFMVPSRFLYLSKATRRSPELLRLELWAHAMRHYVKSAGGRRELLSLEGPGEAADTEWSGVLASAWGLPPALSQRGRGEICDEIWQTPSVLVGVQMRDGTLSLAEGEVETMSLARGARHASKSQRDVGGESARVLGVRTVVMGHTHSVLNHDAGSPVINPGAWVPRLLTPVEALLANPEQGAELEYELNYVDIPPVGEPDLVCRLRGRLKCPP